MDVEKWIRKNVKCCACGKPLKNSKYINGVLLERKARWKNNTWGNVIAEVSGYHFSRRKPRFQAGMNAGMEGDGDET